MAAPPAAAWEPPGPVAYEKSFHAAPVALLLIRADGLVMVDANQPYLDQVQLSLDQLAGRNVFDVFPEADTNDDDQSGVLQTLMRTAIAERRPVVQEGLRYDILIDEIFQVRWWNTVEAPVLGDDGQVEFLLHYSEDVTELYRARDELAAARAAEVRATGLARSQAALAQALTTAQSIGDLQRLAYDTLRTELGADGVTIVSRASDGGWLVTLGEGVGKDFREAYRTLAFDSDLPVVTAARRATRILIPDLATGVAMSSAVADVHAMSGRQAWACLPLGVDTRRLGSVSVSWAEPHTATGEQLELLEAVAAQCGLALDRLAIAAERQASMDQLEALAESLQSAMMPTPPAIADLQLAVRYRSAADVAKVGGDWYDAFLQPDGAVMVTLGDVVGHDHIAAAKMGQISGLLRALAYDAADQPHGIDPVATLLRYEQVATALGIDDLATVVLARIEPDGDGHFVRWSNAGSPPPVLVGPDGEVTLLDDKPDVMLGVDAAAERSEHVVHLLPGATLLLYTDGLVERRDASIDDGITEVMSVLSHCALLDLEEMCDRVLEALAPHIGEDDVAMLAIRPLR